LTCRTRPSTESLARRRRGDAVAESRRHEARSVPLRLPRHRRGGGGPARVGAGRREAPRGRPEPRAAPEHAPGASHRLGGPERRARARADRRRPGRSSATTRPASSSRRRSWTTSSPPRRTCPPSRSTGSSIRRRSPRSGQGSRGRRLDPGARRGGQRGGGRARPPGRGGTLAADHPGAGVAVAARGLRVTVASIVAPGSRTRRPVSARPASARLNASVTWLTGSTQKNGSVGGVNTTR